MAGAFPPEGPGYRADLPKIESERKPVGYKPGLQLEERLQGLGVVVLGLIGLLVVYGVYSGFLPSGLPPPPAPPPGVLVQIPVINPAACFMPLLALGSIGLIFVGIRRVFDP